MRVSTHRGGIYEQGDSLWRTPLCASVYGHTDVGGRGGEDGDSSCQEKQSRSKKERNRRAFEGVDSLRVLGKSRGAGDMCRRSTERWEEVLQGATEEEREEEGKDGGSRPRRMTSTPYRERMTDGIHNQEVSTGETSTLSLPACSSSSTASSSPSVSSSPVFSSFVVRSPSSQNASSVSLLSASARQEASTIVSPPSIHIAMSGNRTHLEAFASIGFFLEAGEEEDLAGNQIDGRPRQGTEERGGGGEGQRESERGRDGRRIRRTLANMPSYCLQAEDILSTIEAVQRPSLLTRLRGLELRSFVIDDQHFFESLVHHLIALPPSERPPLQVLRIQDYENEDISGLLCQSQKHMFFGAEAEAQRRRFRVFDSGNSEEESEEESQEEEEKGAEEGEGRGQRRERSRRIVKRGGSASCSCKACRRGRTARRGRSLLFKKTRGRESLNRGTGRGMEREQEEEEEEPSEGRCGDGEKEEGKKRKSPSLQPPPSPRVNPCPSPYPLDECSSSCPSLSSDFALPPPVWDYTKPFFFYCASSCSPPSHCPPPPVSFLVIPRLMQRNLKCLLHHFPEINRIELSFPSRKFFPSQDHVLDFLGPFAVFLESFSFTLNPVHLQVVVRGCPSCSSQEENETDKQRRPGVERARDANEGAGWKEDQDATSSSSSRNERGGGDCSRQKKKVKKFLLPPVKKPSAARRCCRSGRHPRYGHCIRRMPDDELSVFYVDQKDIADRFKRFQNGQFVVRGESSSQPPLFCLVCDGEQLHEEGGGDGDVYSSGGSSADDATGGQRTSRVYAQMCNEYRESVKRREAIVERHRKALRANLWYRDDTTCGELLLLSTHKTTSSSAPKRRYVLLGFLVKEIVFVRKNTPSPQPLSSSSQDVSVPEVS